MAKPVSEEELQLKKRARRRLIGAVVLVAAVAVVLPMVLDSEPKPTSQEINIQIPAPDAKGFTSKVVPISAPPAKGAVEGKPAAQATAPAAKAPPAVAEKAAPKAVELLKDTAVTEKPAPKPEKAAAKAPESAVTSKPGTFYIQVTALADVDKVMQVQRRIIDAGLLSYTEVVAAGKGTVTRVRAGPFATREEAETAREKLKGIGFEGKVAITQ
jgi:DedD protein